MNLLLSGHMFYIHHTAMHQFTVSLYSKPHMHGVCVFSCNLSPPVLAEWPRSFMCYCSNRRSNRYKIRVSTESWPWRKFSHCSCWNSNLRSFNNGSSAIPLSYSHFPLDPKSYQDLPLLWQIWNQICSLNFLFLYVYILLSTYTLTLVLSSSTDQL